MIGYAATSAMSNIDGDTMKNARRRSERPRERRRCGVAAWTEAGAAMVLEARERLLDVGLGLLHRLRRGGLPPQGRVDVLVDRLRDLRVHRRDRTRLRLRDRLAELIGERQGLAHVGVVVDRRAARREAALSRARLLDRRD